MIWFYQSPSWQSSLLTLLTGVCVREVRNKGARRLMGSCITPAQVTLLGVCNPRALFCFQTLGKGIMKLLSLSFPRFVSFVYFLTIMSHPRPSRREYFNSWEICYTTCELASVRLLDQLNLYPSQHLVVAYSQLVNNSYWDLVYVQTEPCCCIPIFIENQKTANNTPLL